MLLAAGTLAQAASYNTATESTGWQGLGFTDTLYLPQFDTSLGTLTGVTLHITDSEQAEVTIENGSASPASITVNLAGSVEATDNDTIDSIALLDQSFGPYSLAANEGPIIPTYNGSGPDFQDLGLISDTATKTAFSSDISLYEGSGTVPIDVTGAGGWNASGSTAYSLNINEFVGEGSVYATYTYTPAPEPSSALFLGLGGLALACYRRFTR
ncbi:MAG: choice-of-anchor E domain-containing protein [Verrucomicrobiia bacterium]